VWGDKLRKFRKEMGLSQEELSEMTGFHQTSISSWEKNSYPPLEYISKVLSVIKPNMNLWQFFAPEDLIIPDVEPELKIFIQKYQKLPQEIRVQCTEACEAVLRAYNFGVERGKSS